jgi:small ligand-binding sensory domain FIST
LVGNIHVALPVVGSDTGDYVVRNLIGVDMERGLLALGEPVDKGDRLFFVSRDADAARQDLIAMTTRLKKRSGGTPKAGLYVSCIARGPQMFSDENSEIELIRLILGDIPLVGVYLNGEISNNRLYTYTGVLTLFN